MCDTIARITDSAALFAKNSDRSPNEPQVIEWHPAAMHDEKIIMTTYIEVDQVRETKAHVLSRPVWLWGGEMGVNECGVCIGNEAVFTKGGYPKSGLTGMDMLRLALERSESAEKAVACLIELLEKYGQGGNCGYDHSFFYDNAFLVMDRSDVYVLETSGKKWVYKKSDRAAISNRLSIEKEGDCYSGRRCNFRKKHTDVLYTHFAQSKQRREMCCDGVEKANGLADMFSALRRHEDESAPLCRASVGSPCMHYGGMVGDHTTQSMAVELPENGDIRLWVTGRSMPCVSIFKPFAFGDASLPPIYPAGTGQAQEYWMDAERFHRQILGHILPEEFYAERDAIEEELIRMTRDADAERMHQISLHAREVEQMFYQKWGSAQLQKGKTSASFKSNWKKKNALLGKESERR